MEEKRKKDKRFTFEYLRTEAPGCPGTCDVYRLLGATKEKGCLRTLLYIGRGQDTFGLGREGCIRQIWASNWMVMAKGCLFGPSVSLSFCSRRTTGLAA